MAVAKMAQNTLEKKIREKLNREVERLRYATKNMTHKEGRQVSEERYTKYTSKLRIFNHTSRLLHKREYQIPAKPKKRSKKANRNQIK